LLSTIAGQGIARLDLSFEQGEDGSDLDAPISRVRFDAWWELSRIRGEARLSRLDDVTGSYMSVRALARATQEACRQTVDVLRSG
jgi:hypothetical protein